MSYITTFTGIDFYPQNFSEDDFNIIDIAHALSMNCRWAGHCSAFYSVAQHSVYVSRFMKKNKKLGLLHDGSEAYGSDMPTPFKRILPDFQKLENEIQDKIYQKFLGQSPSESDIEELKWADRLLLNWEGTIFIKNWQDTVDKNLIYEVDPSFHPWQPTEAKQNFINEFNELINT